MFLDYFPNSIIRVFKDKNKDGKGWEVSKSLLNKNYFEYTKKNNLGVFFTPNGMGNTPNYKGNFGTNNNTQYFNAFFVDFDKGTKQEQQKKIKESELLPSLIVESKRGYHCYWLLEDNEYFEGKTWRHYQSELIKKFGGDEGCKNESRLMRLPESYHCKQEPYLVKVIYNTGKTFDGGFFIEKFKLPAPYVPKTKKVYSGCYVPKITCLRSGDRHKALVKEAASMKYINGNVDSDILTAWYLASCVNQKAEYREEIENVIKWCDETIT